MFTALENFDFNMLQDSEFKEDSVREEIIHPILKELGYSAGGLNRIVRSRSLSHPFVKTGSGDREIRIIPDYLLLAANKPAWVLDAKSPTQNITSGGNVEQTYFYAIHPDIRSRYFALCNGREFALFEREGEEMALYFQISEIEGYWQNLYQLLGPHGFLPGKRMISASVEHTVGGGGADFYANVKPLPQVTDLRRRSLKRYFGVHPYFTRQVWNVVQEYIKNFSQPDDLILDPFGGSGVTAIEAIVLGRKGIHIDINPLSNFIVKSLVQPVDLNELGAAYELVVEEYERLVPKSDSEIRSALEKYCYPRGIILPGDSDVDTIEKLFSDRQLAELALLKHLIFTMGEGDIRAQLLLMFSGLLNRINLTYHTNTYGGGDSGIMRYYRYRIAPNPTISDTLHYFGVRYKSIISAKKELAPLINESNHDAFQAYQGTATDLNRIHDETVDYIYTDPPYGAKIQYLDLSTMWLAWLDLPVSGFDRQQEIIEGGRLEKTKEEYSDLMAQSIHELYRVMKYDRWMSFVFADKNPAYWHTIVETAEQAGFEYMGAVPQSNSTRSFKKVQHPSTVLSGQLIINFRKVRSPRAIMKLDLGDDATDLILETAEGVIAENDGATIEEINSELIIKGIELGFLDLLSRKYDDLSPLLDAYFDLDDETQKYHLPQNKKFKSAIPVDLRLRYFLLSYLKRQQQQGIDPEFSDIVQSIMPLLKNGITPENQTFLNVLRVWARELPSGRWSLRDAGQQRFDGF